MAESSIIFTAPQGLQSVLDTGSIATLTGPLTINSGGQPIIFNNIEITDGFGAKYDADYSATGILDPRWIPDYGTVQTLVSGAAQDLQAVCTLGSTATVPTNILFATGNGTGEIVGWSTKYNDLANNAAGNMFSNIKSGASSNIRVSSDATSESAQIDLSDNSSVKALFNMKVTGTGGFATPEGEWRIAAGAAVTSLLLTTGTFKLNAIVKDAATYVADPGFIDDSFVPKLYVDQAYATGETYTVTNVTTDRTYDADSSSVDELADVLGTLITDLKTVGIIL